ncbi:MAG: hypothetical protein MUO92_02830, partial [Dehalococcoidales bacterium]|nr:hypothetical protein [Dehalococcoidales bacterium]
MYVWDRNSNRRAFANKYKRDHHGANRAIVNAYTYIINDNDCNSNSNNHHDDSYDYYSNSHNFHNDHGCYYDRRQAEGCLYT